MSAEINEIGNVEELVPNTFNNSSFVPVGTPQELQELCKLLHEGKAIIRRHTECAHSQVHNITIRKESGSIEVWVNTYWKDRLREAQLSCISSWKEIPENSPTISMDDTVLRFSSADWYSNIRKLDILLVGAGGIGSNVAFLLSRLKPDRIRIYDGDTVDETNLAGQFFSQNDVDINKSKAVAQLINRYSPGTVVYSYPHLYTSESHEGDIVLSGLDNMEARKLVYNKWKAHISEVEDPSRCILIDGRLAAEEFQVLTITGDDLAAQKEYEEKWLFSDDEAERTICSYKQTTFMASMIASVMVNILVNFVANWQKPLFEREVPFCTSYDAHIMYFKMK